MVLMDLQNLPPQERAEYLRETKKVQGKPTTNVVLLEDAHPEANPPQAAPFVLRNA